MKHIVLLGDSLFDNIAYVDGGLDVVGHLKKQIPAYWKASLRAVDGSLVENVPEQAQDLPEDASHLIISTGGNNALMNIDILERRANSSTEVLNDLANRASTFEYHYRRMLEYILSLNKRTAVCTVYYPNYDGELVQKISATALTIFNDVIIKYAFLAKIPLIDLRLVCNERADYANEIEPSDAGGKKIAGTVLKLVREHDFEKERTEVFY